MYSTYQIFPPNFVYILHAPPKSTGAVNHYFNELEHGQDVDTKKEHPEYDQLQAEICDGKLVMSIGVSLLCSAVTQGPYLAQLLKDENVQITDEQAFVDAIKQELLALEDDGCNLIHRALDQAAEHAVERRCNGIEFKNVTRSIT